MSIAYGGIVAFLFRVLNVGVAFLTVLIATHALSADDYGVLALAVTSVGIVTAVTSGLTAATAYQVANRRHAPGEALFSAGGLAIAAGVLAVLAGVIATNVLRGEASTVSLAVGAISAAVFVNGTVGGVFLGANDLVRYNITLVAPPVLALVAMGIVFFGLGHHTPEAALTATACGQWLAAAGMLAVSARSFRQFRFSSAIAAHVLRFTALAGLASGISFLNYRADLFMVNHFEEKSSVAVYSLAGYLAESVWQVSSSLALATYARLASVTRPEAVTLTTRVMRHTLVILGAICLVLFLGAGLLESVLFGEKYAGMASALRFLLPGVLLYSLAQAFSAYYTYQRGLPWVSAIVAGGGLIIDLALDVALIPSMGVNGAALASSLAYSTAIIVALAVFVRMEGVPMSDIFRFGRADLDDYRQLIARVRALVGRTAATPNPR